MNKENIWPIMTKNYDQSAVLSDRENFAEWKSDEFGDMKCFLMYVRDVTKLDKFEDKISQAIIDAEENKDYCYDVAAEIKDFSHQTYLELQLSFDKDNNLREFLVLEQALVGEWSDQDKIGQAFMNEDGVVTSHSMLSIEEFDYAVNRAKEAIKLCFPEN